MIGPTECGKPGKGFILPLSYINLNYTLSGLSQILLRLRFGIFGGVDQESELSITSDQFTMCEGKSAREVLESNPSFIELRSKKFTPPKFSVIKQSNPRFMIVLENTQSMNFKNSWRAIRTSLRSLIMEKLPDNAEVGIVLFNAAAHVAHHLTRLESPRQRQSLSLKITSKHNLFPSAKPACWMCGISAAIQELGEQKSSGGVIILISNGKAQQLPQTEHQQVSNLLLQHQIELFSIVLNPGQPMQLESSPERSWLLNLEGSESTKTYLDLLDIFRLIQTSTLELPESLVSLNYIKNE